jgi:hypothetical protein
MLHDGRAQRLLMFKASTRNKLYQFGLTDDAYQLGAGSVRELTLVDLPDDVDPSSFTALHSGGYYHVYLRRLGDPTTLYQFGWVPGTSVYTWGFESLRPTLHVEGFPPDTDWARWTMLHDGNDYRFYAGRLGSTTQLYQGAWDGSHYTYGHRSIPTLDLEGAPADCELGSFAMLHDGERYRLFLRTR